MPSERHIRRQIAWSDELRQHGCDVKLEETVFIKNARVIVDVYAKAEGKTFLIEIGDIEDERKTALMQFHAQQNPNIEFIHEPYGSNMIQKVLESIQAYRNSTQYKLLRQRSLDEQNQLRQKIKADQTIIIVSLILGIISIAVTAFFRVEIFGIIIFAFLVIFCWEGFKHLQEKKAELYRLEKSGHV